MRLLLDTHIVLWALLDDARLPAKARSLILDARNDPFLSVVAAWEVAIKHGRHPDLMHIDAGRFLDLCEGAGFRTLSVAERHVRALEHLRRQDGTSHHADPFDRIMLAQAKADGFALVTHDSALAAYGEPCVLLV